MPDATPPPGDPQALLDRLHEVDESVFRAVAGWHAPALDRTMPALSEVASYSRLWMGVSAVLAIAGGRRGRWAAAAGMAAIGVTSAVANVVLKGLTNRRRPQAMVPEGRRLEHPESTSFPSGHTASAAAFSGVVGSMVPGLWAPLNALAAAVGFSRVYTGVHYPGDVAAGWLLGKVVATVTLWTARRWEARAG